MPVKKETVVNTENTLNIRPAVLKDAAAIAALLYESFAEYKPLYTERGFAASALSQKEIEDRISKKAVWVALYDNKIAGTVSLLPHQQGLFIRSMAVSSLARKKGVGTYLMKHIHEIAGKNGCTYLMLNTTSFLTEAIRLYESFGFTQEGYDDQHGTLLIKMIKKLEQSTKNKIEKNDYAK